MGGWVVSADGRDEDDVAIKAGHIINRAELLTTRAIYLPKTATLHGTTKGVLQNGAATI